MMSEEEVNTAMKSHCYALLAILLLVTASCHLDAGQHTINSAQKTDAVRKSVEENVISVSNAQSILDSLIIEEPLMHCLYVRRENRWPSLIEIPGYHNILRGKKVKLVANTRVPIVHVALELEKDGRWTSGEWLVPVTVIAGNRHENCVIAIISLRIFWGALNYNLRFQTPTSKYMASKEEILDYYLLSNPKWRAFLHLKPRPKKK